MPPPPPLLSEDHVADKLRLEPPQEPNVVVVDHVNPGELKKERLFSILEETALLFFPLVTLYEPKEVEKDCREVETGNITRHFSRRLSSTSEIRRLHSKPPPSTAVTKLLLTLRLSPPPEPSTDCSDRMNFKSSDFVPGFYCTILRETHRAGFRPPLPPPLRCP